MSPKLLNLLLLISSGALYYLVISPVYTGESSGVFEIPGDSIQALIKKEADYDATIQTAKDTVTLSKKIKKEYAVFDDATKEKMSIMVPDTINEVKLLNEITKMAILLGLPIDNLGVKDTNGGEYNVYFTVETTYVEFKNFMSKFEKSARLYTLQSVSFPPGKRDEDIIKFTVALSTYYMNKTK